MLGAPVAMIGGVPMLGAAVEFGYKQATGQRIYVGTASGVIASRSVISFICCLRSTAMQALLFLDPSCFHLARILVSLFRCFYAVPLQSPGLALTGVPGSFPPAAV